MSTLDLEQVVTLTSAASNRVKSLLIEKGLQGYGLRVFVGGGGCGGLQYGMAFENEEQEGDFVMNFDGVKVMIDSMSSQYLMGANVDYVDNVMGGGFKIDNPSAVSTCGCGHSFRASGQAPSASNEAACGCH